MSRISEKLVVADSKSPEISFNLCGVMISVRWKQIRAGERKQIIPSAYADLESQIALLSPLRELAPNVVNDLAPANAPYNSHVE